MSLKNRNTNKENIVDTMKYAKSMYRGGLLANAETCDYESSRHLGLVCPFCSQAVFLRRGTFYQRLEKQVVVSPSFAHYKNDDPLSEDCELRSTRKDGQDYLKTLEIESREQRLELYNKRLWDVVRQDMNVTEFHVVLKAFGNRWIEQTSRFCRNDLRKTLDFYLEESRKVWTFQLQADPKLEPLAQKIANSIWTKEERLADFRKLNSFDKQLHQVIFEEVIEFVSTRTGGYAFQNLFKLALVEWCATLWAAKQKTPARSIAIPLFAEQVKKIPPQQINQMICILITRVNWVALFYDLERQDDQQ